MKTFFALLLCRTKPLLPDPPGQCTRLCFSHGRQIRLDSIFIFRMDSGWQILGCIQEFDQDLEIVAIEFSDDLANEVALHVSGLSAVLTVFMHCLLHGQEVFQLDLTVNRIA